MVLPVPSDNQSFVVFALVFLTSPRNVEALVSRVDLSWSVFVLRLRANNSTNKEVIVSDRANSSFRNLTTVGRYPLDSCARGMDQDFEFAWDFSFSTSPRNISLVATSAVLSDDPVRTVVSSDNGISGISIDGVGWETSVELFPVVDGVGVVSPFRDNGQAFVVFILVFLTSPRNVKALVGGVDLSGSIFVFRLRANNSSDKEAIISDGANSSVMDLTMRSGDPLDLSARGMD